MIQMLLTARWIAINAHKGQTRRNKVTPYIAHVEDVVRRLRAQGADADTVAVAWLHDVIEDTVVTADHLLAGGAFPAHVVRSVVTLTKTANLDYDAYLRRVKADPVATKVKIADMLSNLSDQPTDKQIVKYANGLLFLMDEEQCPRISVAT